MSVADRFAEYVAELHELSDSHRLPHGKPKDLVRLLEEFHNSVIFAADFGCVMRSIALRENLDATETELLTIVAVAWAGAEPDDSAPQLSEVIEELRGVLHKSLAQKVLSHRTEEPTSWEDEVPVEMPDLSQEAPDFSSELSPWDSKRMSYNADESFVSAQRDLPPENSAHNAPGGAQRGPELVWSSQNVPYHEALDRRAPGKEDRRSYDRRKSSNHSPISESGSATQISSTRRLEPSASEILAMGLVGLITALLFNVAALPVYRARVSVYLPSTITSATDVNAGTSSPSSSVSPSGSRSESLVNGDATERTSQRMLALPHAATLLRQDLLSRGMRDLHLGGHEPILYADLVGETASQVKVTHLPQQYLYEVTCDSWSAQFAAMFCNQLTDAVVNQPSDATPPLEGTESARIVDAASQPGSPIYPHWYVQGFAGLVGGCLIGVMVGFVKRPEKRPVPGNDHSTE